MGRTPGSKNKKQKQVSKKLLVAKTMPPLYHTLPGEEFDNDKSQVYAWMKNQPDLMQWLWRQLVRLATSFTIQKLVSGEV